MVEMGAGGEGWGGGVLGDTEGGSERWSDRKERKGKLLQGGQSGPCGAPPPHCLAPRAQTHQTAEVWPVEPGGGDTKGHVSRAFSHLGLQVVGELMGGGCSCDHCGVCCVRVRDQPHHSRPHSPTNGQEVGGAGARQMSPFPGDLHRQRLGGQGK